MIEHGYASHRALLRSWGADLRSARARRRRLYRRAIALALLNTGLAATILLQPRPLLVWNASASAPMGLYGVGGISQLRRGDMVIARVPQRYRMLAAQRHYIPGHVPLVKRVAAVPGDTVCALRSRISVNGRAIAKRRARDGKGQLLPWWQGCVRLGKGALFLLMDHPASFDGRYFGPTDAEDIIGGARALWTWR